MKKLATTALTIFLTASMTFAQNEDIVIIKNRDTLKMSINDKNFFFFKGFNSKKQDSTTNSSPDTVNYSFGNMKFRVITDGNKKEMYFDENNAIDSLNHNFHQWYYQFTDDMNKMLKDLDKELEESFKSFDKEFELHIPKMDFHIPQIDIDIHRNQYEKEQDNRNEEEKEDENYHRPETKSKSTIKKDTVNIRMGKKDIMIITDPRVTNISITRIEPREEDKERSSTNKSEDNNTEYLILGLGVNTYLYDGGLELPDKYDFLDVNIAKSIAVKLQFFETKVNLIKKNLRLGFGVGLDYNNYRFSKNSTLMPDTSLLLATMDKEKQFKKNKLTTKYISFPLYLQFQTNKNKHKKRVSITAGVFAGYLLKSYTKQVYDLNGKKYKDKVYDDYNLEKLKYGVLARFGYGHFRLFANYTLTNLFEEDAGIALNALTVGVSLVGL